MRLTQDRRVRTHTRVDSVFAAWIGVNLPAKPIVDVFELGIIDEEFARATAIVGKHRYAGFQWTDRISAELSSRKQILVHCAIALPPLHRVRLDDPLPLELSRYLNSADALEVRARELCTALRRVLYACSTTQQFLYVVPAMRSFLPSEFVVTSTRRPRVPAEVLDAVANARLNEHLAPLALLPSLDGYIAKAKNVYEFTDTALEKYTND